MDSAIRTLKDNETLA